MFSNPWCHDCKDLMRGPLFWKGHRDPDRLVDTGVGNFVARADCYYRCEKCESLMVFDSNWDENTRNADVIPIKPDVP